MVSTLDGGARSNLILPLSGHNLSIGSRDLDSSVEASLVVSVSYSSSEADVASDRAIVRSLVSRESSGWPSVGSGLESSMLGEKSVFLFDSEPRFLLGKSIKDLGGVNSEVGVSGDELLIGSVSPGVGLTENHDVVSSSEGIREEEARLEDDLRVLSSGLVSGGSIVIPVRKILDILRNSSESSGLRSHSHGSINPDVLSDDHTLLVEVLEEGKIVVGSGLDVVHLVRV